MGNEDEVELEFLSGAKLALVIIAVIAIALLVMLDMSIIATVSGLPLTVTEVYHVDLLFFFFLKKRQSPKSRVTFTLLRALVGTEARIC